MRAYRIKAIYEPDGGRRRLGAAAAIMSPPRAC